MATAFENLRQRLAWIQSWLQTDSKPTTTQDQQDFEIVNPESPNDYGVESLSSGSSPTRKKSASRSDRHGPCPSCGYNGHATTSPSELPIEPESHPSLRAQTPNALALAGRGDSIHYFADLRSPTKARKRRRNEQEKYYSYRFVNRGELGKPHYDVPRFSFGECDLLQDWAVVELTSEQLYRQAQMYPRPPKLHRKTVDKKYGPLSQRVLERRREKKMGETRKEADYREAEEVLWYWGQEAEWSWWTGRRGVSEELVTRIMRGEDVRDLWDDWPEGKGPVEGGMGDEDLEGVGTCS